MSSRFLSHCKSFSHCVSQVQWSAYLPTDGLFTEVWTQILAQNAARAFHTLNNYIQAELLSWQELVLRGKVQDCFSIFVTWRVLLGHCFVIASCSCRHCDRAFLARRTRPLLVPSGKLAGVTLACWGTAAAPPTKHRNGGTRC